MRMRVAAGALAVALAAGLAGCEPSNATPSVTPSHAAEVVFSSDEAALSMAKDAYLDYRRVAELVLAGGGVDQGQIAAVATGQLLKDEVAGDQEFVARGYRSVGSSVLVDMSLQQAKHSVPADAAAALVAYVCIDVSAVDVLNMQGQSVISGNRSPRVQYEVTFDTVGGKLLPSKQDPWNSSGSTCA